MSEVDVDVAVVGAGPAGSAAALRLAERGLQVALVERGDSPGSKNLSGGVLYPATLAAAVPSFAADAPYERRVVRHVTTLLQRESVVSLDYTDSALGAARGEAAAAAAPTTAPNAVTVLRAHFDPWLAGKAEEAGAFLMPGLKVEALATQGSGSGTRVVGIVSDGSVMRAHAVVAADGVNSFLARGAGLRPDPRPDQLAVGIKAVLRLGEERIEDRFGVGPGEGAAHAIVGDATAGVAGGAFLYTNRDSLSVGIVVRLDALVASGRTASELIEHLLGHPGLARYLEGAELVEYGSHLVAEGGAAMVGDVAHAGLAVVGDAAGLTINSGLVLRGMDLAVTSGLVAGDAVADAVQAGDTSASGMARYAAALEASPAMADMRTYARTPSFLEREGPYGPWGQAAQDVLRSAFVLDGAPRRPLRTLLRGAARRQSWRTWLGDASAGWRAL
ncbi:MAG TPA: FAD-dependent oxidoreductase [Micrococcales bacterium]|uniref:FAD-dependent oxidoreductase n=1 Tax=Miniimonas arenae TaxID=676201 RepID=A0A5C5BAJ0_9MICO|nr:MULTISPECIES: FAD-dependent oxidoreductase [Miniimonas]TNU73711.1 FAD-dependent oxidoreductase [Miniimonas arenae]HCX84373.1 FAD-dependent oxidoreductase [Micrococcales bacterium]